MDRMRPESVERTDSPAQFSRRRLLALTGSTVTAGLAGCNDDGNPSDTPATTPRETDGVDATETPTESPTERPGDTPTETPADRSHFADQPDMRTPWFDDVSRENPHSEYPRPQLVRDDWQSLNGEWEVELLDETFGDPPDPPFDRELPDTVLVPFPIESQLSGVRDHAYRLWYRTTFTVPDDWDVDADGGDRLLLHFERVDWEATVYVNGEELTTHRGGYDHFAVDVTDHLTGGAEELVLRVYDPSDYGTQAHGKQEVRVDDDIFFTPATGIWDSVWLEPVPEAHVTSLDASPDLDAEALRLTVDAANAADATVDATALDDGNEVGTVTGPAGEELEVPVPDPHQWSPEDPHLYDLEIRLLDADGTPVDSVESYFGMRSVGTEVFDGVLRPTLNGEFVFRQGIYDQGYWPDGVYTPPTDEARRFNLETVKDLGFNTLRKHIKVESRRWFYWTDRLGLLVWQDVPQQPLGQPEENEQAEARDQFEAEMTRMIEQNGNHPSLTTWIPANEGWGFGKHNPERIRETVALVEDLDDERLVNPMSGINTCECDPGNGDMIDLHNYSQVTPVPEPTDERISVVGESSAGWVPIPDHSWGYGTGGTPADLVSNLLSRARTNERLMREEGFSAAINLQVTDTEHHWQGVITYDREVLKPDRVSDDAVDRIREANRDLIDASRDL